MYHFFCGPFCEIECQHFQGAPPYDPALASLSWAEVLVAKLLKPCLEFVNGVLFTIRVQLRQNTDVKEIKWNGLFCDNKNQETKIGSESSKSDQVGEKKMTELLPGQLKIKSLQRSIKQPVQKY